MTGDIKSEEFFYRIQIRDGFQEKVRKCRKEFGIPENGFLTEKDSIQWEHFLKPLKYAEFMSVVDEILNSYKLSNAFLPMLEEYITTDQTGIIYKNLFHPFCEIDAGGFTSKRNIKNKKPFVGLLIYNHATLEEVQQYLKIIWKFIKRDLERQSGGYVPRIRQTSHKNRDEEILMLYSKSRAELGLKKGERKETKISEILKDRYEFLYSDHIKKIVTKRRNLKKRDS